MAARLIEEGLLLLPGLPGLERRPLPGCLPHQGAHLRFNSREVEVGLEATNLTSLCWRTRL